MKFTCKVSKVEQTELRTIKVIELDAEGNVKIMFEYPEHEILARTPAEEHSKYTFKEGEKVEFTIDKSKDEVLKNYDIVMKGYVYLVSKTDEKLRYYISIGGLQARIETPSDLGLKEKDELYIGIKKI